MHGKGFIVGLLLSLALPGEVVSSSSLAGVRIDTRPTVEGARLLDGAADMLPIVCSNAAVRVTEMCYRQDGVGAWTPRSAEETLAEEAAGERTVAWPVDRDDGFWRVCLTRGAEVVSTAYFNLSGLAAAAVQIDVKNADAPCIGKALTATARTVEGALSDAVAVRWYRYDDGQDWREGEIVGEEASYAPGIADCEHWLRPLVVCGKDFSLTGKAIWFSKLPVCYITTDDGTMPTMAKEEHTGRMRLQGNATYTKSSQLYDGVLDAVHVRGNSTAQRAKKPYKLKLADKTNLLGMGKNKHWILGCNYQDPGLMRNKMLYDLSGELGLVSMSSTWVDVIFNGSYVGNYQLCEHIRIGSTRIDIHDWEEDAADVAKALAKRVEGLDADALEDELCQNMDWITSGRVAFGGVTYELADAGIDVGTYDTSGGFIFELDGYADEQSMFTATSGIISTLVKVNAPEFLRTNAGMFQAAADLWKEFFDAVQSLDGIAPGGRHYAQIADIDTMAAYWLTEVISANSDAAGYSRYAFKPQGRPLQWGPAWDFDGSIGYDAQGWTRDVDANGNVVRVVPRNDCSSGWHCGTTTTGYGGVKDNFFPLWCDDPLFCLKLWELWRAKRATIFHLVEEGGWIDENYDYLLESGIANAKVWPVQTQGNSVFPFEGEYGFARCVQRLLKQRLEWIDAQMVSLGTLIASLRAPSADHPYTDAVGSVRLQMEGAVTRFDATADETVDVFVRGTTAFPCVAQVTMEGVASVDVAVDGCACGNVAVVDGRIAFSLPATAFTAAPGRRSLVSFIGRDGTGGVACTTYALVTVVAPEDWPPRAGETVSCDACAVTLDTREDMVRTIPDRAALKALPPIAYSGSDWKGGDAGAATVRVTGPDGAQTLVAGAADEGTQPWRPCAAGTYRLVHAAEPVNRFAQFVIDAAAVAVLDEIIGTGEVREVGGRVGRLTVAAGGTARIDLAGGGAVEAEDGLELPSEDGAFAAFDLVSLPSGTASGTEVTCVQGAALDAGDRDANGDVRALIRAPAGYRAVAKIGATGDLLAQVVAERDLMPQGDTGPLLDIRPRDAGCLEVRAEIANGVEGFWYSLMGAETLLGPWTPLPAAELAETGAVPAMKATGSGVTLTTGAFEPTAGGKGRFYRIGVSETRPVPAPSPMP